MRKVFATLIALLMLAAPAAMAEEKPSIDLDSMTVEELTALHQEIGRRLTLVNSGDVVYDEDGIKICWGKLLDLGGDMFRYGFTMENTTGEDYGFKLSMTAINGMQFRPFWNTDKMRLMNNFALYTGSYHNWMPDNYLADMGITHVNDIYLQIELYKPEGDSYERTPCRVIDVRFPVDIDISGELE